jgi:beta-N-acetylhexosaminidase
MVFSRTSLENLSEAQRVGQLFMVGFEGTSPSQDIIDLIQLQHVGGIILFSRNIGDAGQVSELTRQLQTIAREAGHPYPLLIAIDQENGMVQRLGRILTPLPGNMALGAIGDEEIVSQVAEATGRQLRSLGINMNLAPDVDVNNNPANPVIGVRSFGDDASQVARLAAAAVRGYHRSGIISSVKHFPGHGDTATDSHLGVPVLPFSLERLDSIEFPPFVSSIQAGADTVMVAHVAMPRFTGGENTPATVSSAVIGGLLREHLNYQGVIISDCLEMEAISATVGTARGAVLALEAGVDLVLISHRYTRQRGGIELVYEALGTGELSREVVTRAAEKILHLKGRYLSWTAATAPGEGSQIDTGQYKQLGEQAYRRSTTLVRSEAGLLPLRLDQPLRILVLAMPPESVTPAVDLAYPHQFLVDSIRQRHANTEGMCLDSLDTREEESRLANEIAEADLVIMVTINAHLDERQAILMRRILDQGKRTIGLAACDPYDIAVFPDLATYLVTYEYTKAALAAAVQVLFGEEKATGRLPVTIPGLSRQS